jgi:hypothetical protein
VLRCPTLLSSLSAFLHCVAPSLSLSLQVAAARERYMSEGARGGKTDAGGKVQAGASEDRRAGVSTSGREQDKQ